MISVLKPDIASIVNGLITVQVLSASSVAAVFDQLLIFKASASSGPFSQLAAIPLTGATSYTYLDVDTAPNFYYKAQFYNTGTLVSSVFSELAQESGIFNPYAVPTTTATYPPEIALSSQDREIVESIRLGIGDLGDIEIDVYDSSSSVGCNASISLDGRTWELSDPRGWPQRVILNGAEKTSLNDPQVLGYKFLTFSGTSAVITGTLSIWYNHFRFSDHEILLAYDRATNLMKTCPLPAADITTEMRIMQASILLLEGELRAMQSRGAVVIRDGDTEYNTSRSGDLIRTRNEELIDFRSRLKDMIECARSCNMMSLEGVRID